jgi:hypothetical protein
MVTKSDVLNQMITIESEDGRLASIPVGEFEVLEPASRQSNEDEDDDWGQDIDLDALRNLEEGQQLQRPRRPRPPSR